MNEETVRREGRSPCGKRRSIGRADTRRCVGLCAGLLLLQIDYVCEGTARKEKEEKRIGWGGGEKRKMKKE